MVFFALITLTVLVIGGVHVAGVLGFLAVTLDGYFSPAPFMRAVGQIAWTVSTDFVLVAIPMFVLMGELLLKSGLAGNMYRALDKWLGWLPGGLMHTNLASAALFAATSGSSVATAATIGTLSIPNLDRTKYNVRIFLGTLAAGGTLGILIPPSINLIIYGVLAESSVTRLYLAALVPGVMLALIFMVFVLVLCLMRPDWGGGKRRFEFSFELVGELVHLIPPLALFLAVVGSIYAGIATPTEAAAFGVVGAAVFSAMRRALTPKVFLDACAAAMRTTCMMMLIVLAAFVLNFVMVGVGLTRELTAIVVGLGWPPLATMIAIIIFYLILGCFMETVSMMIATSPVVIPIIIKLGYDPIWFGVVFVILIEIALITPPIGVNLFVIQSVRRRGSIADVIAGSLPFVVLMLCMIAILLTVPGLALWLPNTVLGGRL